MAGLIDQSIVEYFLDDNPYFTSEDIEQADIFLLFLDLLHESYVLLEVKFMQRHGPACTNNANLNVDTRTTCQLKNNRY